MLLDPMFPRLAEFVGPEDRVLDIGCGYGVPGTWLLALHPNIQLRGIEPDRERAQVAGRAWGSRGVVTCAAAPELPPPGEPVDVVMLLDMAHYLDDPALRETLARIRAELVPGGRLVIRVTVPSTKGWAWERCMERIRCVLLRWDPPHFRTTDELTDLLADEGFEADLVEPTASGREETWVRASLSDQGSPTMGDEP